MNCCCIEIFEIFETPKSFTTCTPCMLWIAVVLRSLKYLKHRSCCKSAIYTCCELLLYWDLWNIWNTFLKSYYKLHVVVNCCCIEIFEIFETPLSLINLGEDMLWIAVVLRSLKYLKHHVGDYQRLAWVVNCCCIEIFEIFETPICLAKCYPSLLWIAVVLRSLKYLKHHVAFKKKRSCGCELLLYWDLWNIWNT